MTKKWALLSVIAALSLAVLADSLDGETDAQQAINPADFSATITNPYFPLSLIGPKVLEGRETDPDTDKTIRTRLESRLLARTETVMGVTVAVLEEKAYENDVLIEFALDYFAQHRDGSVYYFGELVDNYEDGKLRDHAGQWIAGQGSNQPGIMMPAQPKLGDSFQTEYATGVAEDMVKVLSVSEFVAVLTGSYQNCIRTLDTTPLEPTLQEYKWYCPGIGMAKELGDGSFSELISIAQAPAIAPPSPTATRQPATPVSQSTAAPPIQPPSTGDAGLATGGNPDFATIRRK